LPTSFWKKKRKKSCTGETSEKKKIEGGKKKAPRIFRSILEEKLQRTTERNSCKGLGGKKVGKKKRESVRKNFSRK